MVPTPPSDAQRRYLSNEHPSLNSGDSPDRRDAGLLEQNDQLVKEMNRLREQCPSEDVILLSQILKIQESERRLAAHEIHDGIAQLLIGALMQLEILSQSYPARGNSEASAFSLLDRWLHQALDKARSVIDDLHPPKSLDAGLEAAIESLAMSYLLWRRPVRIDFNSNLDGRRFDPLFEDAVIRLIRKGLADAMKFGDVDRMGLLAKVENGQLGLELSGWRRDFDSPIRTHARFGLASVRERVRFLRGTFTVHPSSDFDLTFRIRLPVPRW